jgi:hypothetical protein
MASVLMTPGHIGEVSRDFRLSHGKTTTPTR